VGIKNNINSLINNSKLYLKSLIDFRKDTDQVSTT